MKKWSQEDIEDLLLGLKIGLTHAEIADCLDRTLSSVMHKVQRLKLAKPNTQWTKLYSKEEVIALIQKYKTSEAMDYTEGVPGHKSCQKILGVGSWAACLEAAGLPLRKTAKFSRNKACTFYIVEFLDINGTLFYKYGITQRRVQERYSKKNIKIISQVQSSLEYCQDLEIKFQELVKDKKYLPIDRRFYDDTYGGYSECYIPH